MQISKEMVKQIWNYVVLPDLRKLVKKSNSPVDDFILKTIDLAIKDYITQK